MQAKCCFLGFYPAEAFNNNIKLNHFDSINLNVIFEMLGF